MIEAKIIADSVNRRGNRLTSFILTYPRFIHSELMTHRMFSRNAASSRAIPFSRMVRMIEERPAMPEHWGAEQKGMQSGDEIENTKEAAKLWIYALQDAARSATELQKLGVHKSICNRLLEPFAHITTIVTATEWDNFFFLRADAAAMPEFRILATKMLELYLAHSPAEVPQGGWHIPFGEHLPEGLDEEEKLHVAVARCARLSYMTHEGVIDVKADLDLFARLRHHGHWSPLEHVATPVSFALDEHLGNFSGWLQLRKLQKDENKHLGVPALHDRLKQMKEAYGS